MSRFEQTLVTLQAAPKNWVVTGAAGFIGSNLVDFLLEHNQRVVGLDNFSTGYQHNLDEIEHKLSKQKWANFYFIKGDIRDLDTCHHVCEGADYILHHAALGSVPRSLNDPITSNAVNVGGFLNMLVAARDAKVQSFTYAGSSSTYGDHDALPKIEEQIGNPLSPYAVTKYVNELYASVFARNYGLHTIGLRYFNVFGQRQNRHGAYAAVIPKWVTAMIQNEDIHIYGDGETSRDFCFIDNVIQANILAATADDGAKNQIYNIALNDNTNLTSLFHYLKEALSSHGVTYLKEPIYQDFRPGDMRHSQAEISKATHYLGYKPKFKIRAGIEKAMAWYIDQV